MKHVKVTLLEFSNGRTIETVSESRIPNCLEVSKRKPVIPVSDDYYSRSKSSPTRFPWQSNLPTSGIDQTIWPPVPFKLYVWIWKLRIYFYFELYRTIRSHYPHEFFCSSSDWNRTKV